MVFWHAYECMEGDGAPTQPGPAPFVTTAEAITTTHHHHRSVHYCNCKGGSAKQLRSLKMLKIVPFRKNIYKQALSIARGTFMQAASHCFFCSGTSTIYIFIFIILIILIILTCILNDPHHAQTLEPQLHHGTRYRDDAFFSRCEGLHSTTYPYE